MKNSRIAAARVSLPVLLAACLCAGSANAAIHQYVLMDHPDGNQNPPPYGLRLDKLFTGNGIDGVVTFSFGDPGSSMNAFVDDVANTMRIVGTAVGGRDQNALGWDPEVTAAIDFTYQTGPLGAFDPTNPQIMLNGLADSILSTLGTGTVEILSSSTTPALVGNEYTFSAKTNNGGNAFNFKDTNHRGFDGINGWGWVRVTGAQDKDGNALKYHSGQTQDWLFTAELVPEPMAIVVWAGLGVAGCLMIRRRMA